jgi:hypothetical protein
MKITVKQLKQLIREQVEEMAVHGGMPEMKRRKSNDVAKLGDIIKNRKQLDALMDVIMDPPFHIDSNTQIIPVNLEAAKKEMMDPSITHAFKFAEDEDGTIFVWNGDEFGMYDV